MNTETAQKLRRRECYALFLKYTVLYGATITVIIDCVAMAAFSKSKYTLYKDIYGENGELYNRTTVISTDVRYWFLLGTTIYSALAIALIMLAHYIEGCCVCMECKYMKPTEFRTGSDKFCVISLSIIMVIMGTMSQAVTLLIGDLRPYNLPQENNAIFLKQCSADNKPYFFDINYNPAVCNPVELLSPLPQENTLLTKYICCVHTGVSSPDRTPLGIMLIPLYINILSWTLIVATVTRWSILLWKKENSATATTATATITPTPTNSVITALP